MHLADYRPRSRLRVPISSIEQPRFGVVDAHNHLGPEFSRGWGARPVGEVLAAMDEAGVEIVVDLDGGQGALLEEHLHRYQRPYPDRFLVFAGLAYEEWASHPSFGAMEARRLEQAVDRGARGLKVWKTLGLVARDEAGDRVPVDDARLDPLWETAARLGVPVLIHVADPIAFFDPLDERNERWEELSAHPDWHFWPPGDDGADGYPTFDRLLAELDRLLGRHPSTRFIGAHVGCAPEDLALVSALLDRHDNFDVDMAARMAELGRQPYTARDFFLRYSDRILFGTDEGFDPAMYRVHYRFLETMDESFDYSILDVPPQGRWQIFGLGLPDDVLRKVYRMNARRRLLID